MIKKVSSQNYNLIFNTKTGLTLRWGYNKKDNPTTCPIGPEIADVELSTICNGIIFGLNRIDRKLCPWCYKSNTRHGKNMSLETFKIVLSKLNTPVLTQIAFGIGDIDANPDLFEILEECRKNTIIPNITINGVNLTDNLAQKLANLCGAVAVSHYDNDDLCFNAIEKLNKFGLKQINIHKLLSNETFNSCLELINKVPSKAKCVGSIVFLSLKPKGERNKFTGIKKLDDYKKLFDLAISQNVGVGMDSCSAPAAYQSIGKSDYIEPCESGNFSIYVDVDANCWPCSFCPGSIDFKPINLCKISDFRKEVWNSPQILEWRQKLLNSTSKCDCSFKNECRACPIFEVIPCQTNGLHQITTSVIKT